MKKIAAIIALVLALVLLLTACGDKIEGKWKLKDPTKMGLGTGASAVFEFKDGKLTITIEGDGVRFSIDGTYKVDGKNLTMTYQGEDAKATFEVSGKTLKITDDTGETMEFAKQ